MLVIDQAEALRLFDYGPLIDHLAAEHMYPAAIVGDLLTQSPAGDGILARTGFAPGRGLAVKMATVFPDNQDLPSIHTLAALFDPNTGEPEAVISGNALTWFKTACDSALGSRLLARPDTTELLMVGAGAMSSHLVRAHVTALPSIERVRIWNRSRRRAEEVAATLTDLGRLVDVTDDLEAAVGTAGLISCATMAEEPLVLGQWVQPGTHIDLVGSFTPTMREVDDAVVLQARVFADSRETAVHCGELAIPLAAGTIEHTHLLGDLFDLVGATVIGRQSDHDVTLFENGGGGHLDLMAAMFLLERARSA